MERSLLDAASAAAFLRRLGEHLDYNINIMDRDGIIIASRDQARVGTYHEAAHRLVMRKASIEELRSGEPLPPGVKPGVNLPILHRGEIIGVVGVTGEPSEIAPLAFAVKTSVESMVELEAYKNQAMRRQDRKNTFINYLLYEDEMPRGAVDALAKKLGYDLKLHRAALIVRPPFGLPSDEALAVVKASSRHGLDDISWASPDGLILVFKSIRFREEGVFTAFEEEMRSYLAALATSFGVGAGDLAAAAGAFQTDFARYRGSYRQALWLAGRFPSNGGCFLSIYDKLGEYFVSRMPRSELVDALDSLSSLLPPDFASGLGDSVDALFESAFNGKEAAARLGVHRNTLSARLDRLRRTFGFDLRREARARDILPLLVRYEELRAAEWRIK